MKQKINTNSHKIPKRESENDLATSFTVTLHLGENVRP